MHNDLGSQIRVWAYCGAKMGMAELVAAIDFGEPQRVAETIADRIEHAAFERGIHYAYTQECIPAPLQAWALATDGWAQSFYQQLCREADVR